MYCARRTVVETVVKTVVETVVKVYLDVLCQKDWAVSVFALRHKVRPLILEIHMVHIHAPRHDVISAK
jgi:hypothetical protein